MQCKRGYNVLYQKILGCLALLQLYRCFVTLEQIVFRHREIQVF